MISIAVVAQRQIQKFDSGLCCRSGVAIKRELHYAALPAINFPSDAASLRTPSARSPALYNTLFMIAVIDMSRAAVQRESERASNLSQFSFSFASGSKSLII